MRSKVDVCFVVLALTACAGGSSSASRAPEGHGLLKQVAGLREVRATHQFARLAEGVYTRRLYATTDGAGLHIDVLDLTVRANGAWHGATFPGATVVQVLGGDGSVTEKGRQVLGRDALAGAFPAKTPMDIVNNGDQPFVMRLYVAQENAR